MASLASKLGRGGEAAVAAPEAAKDKFVIVGSRLLTEDEIKTLTANGKLIFYGVDYRLFNIVEIFNKTDATFVFFDINEKPVRQFLSEEFHNLQNYFVVLLKEEGESNSARWMKDFAKFDHSILKAILPKDKKEDFFHYLKFFHKIHPPSLFGKFLPCCN